MTKAIIDDARRVAKALGWHPTAQPCQCWNCQANRALITAADEIERLRAIENAALHVASSFLKRNNTVDPLTMHKLDFALEASAVEPAGDRGAEYDRALEAHARLMHPGVPIMPEGKPTVRMHSWVSNDGSYYCRNCKIESPVPQESPCI